MAQYFEKNGRLLTRDQFQIENELEKNQTILQPKQTLREQLERLKQTNPYVNDLQDLNRDQKTGELSDLDPTAVLKSIRQREALRQQIDKVISDNPTTFGDLKDVILSNVTKGGVSLLDILSRTLNVAVAREAGLAIGLRRQLRGEGTVLDSLNEAVKENYGFAEVLKEFGIPEGPELARLFGIPITSRGTAGFALDVLLDPLTYVSFGASPIIKGSRAAKTIFRAANVSEAGAKSIARFAGRTFLTDKEFTRGVEALKATKAGQAYMKALDAWAASKVGKTFEDVGEELGEAFIPGFGQNKSSFRQIRKANRAIMRAKIDIPETLQKIFAGVSKADRNFYFKAKFNASKSEAAFRASLRQAGLEGEALGREAQKFGRRIFTNPKLNEIDNLLFDRKEGLFIKLARDYGLPDEVLFENYMPSFFEIIAQDMTKGLGSKAIKFLKSKGVKHKSFVEEGLITDPITALSRRGVELAKMTIVNKTLKTLIRAYGQKFASTREALEAGYKDFYPEGFLKIFPREVGEEIVPSVKKAIPTYLPTNVMKSIDELMSFKQEPGFVGRLIDNLTSQFRAFVTAPFAAFHALNFRSNRVQRFVNEGWKSFKLSDDIDSIKTLTNSPDLNTKMIPIGPNKKLTSLATIKAMAQRKGILDSSQFWADIGGAAFDKAAPQTFAGRIANLFNPIPGQNTFIRTMRRVGQGIEDEAKMASFIRGLKDGLNADEAAQVAFTGLFDYSNLTKFERTIMRRLIPFYTFGRKNLELQLGTLLRNPGNQAIIFKLMKDIHNEAIKDLNDDQLRAFNEMKPMFLENSFAFPAGVDNENRVMWVTGFGLPQEDAIDLVNVLSTFGGNRRALGALAFRMNPAIKAIANEALGIDIGRSLSSDRIVALKDTYSVPELQSIFSRFYRGTIKQEEVKEFVNNPEKLRKHPVIGAFATLLDLKVRKKAKFEGSKVTGEEFEFVANPHALNIVRSTFIARMLTTMKQFGDENLDDAQLLTKVLTGMSFFRHDMDQAARFDLKRRKEEATDILKEAGTEGGFQFKRTIASKQASPNVKALVKQLEKRLKL